MSSTNHTTNYNLPQWVGSDKPAWLGDVNPAFSAIDTAMKANDVTATSASTAATTANNNIGTMAELATTEKTTLVGAVNEVNTNAQTAQTTANSAGGIATQTATDLTNFIDKFNIGANTSTANIQITRGSITAQPKLSQNSDGSMFKFYGMLQINAYNSTNGAALPLTSIAGLTGYKGYATGCYLQTAPATAYIISGASYFSKHAQDDSKLISASVTDTAVGTDGQIYVLPLQTSDTADTWGAGTFIRFYFPPCVYFNANFGDLPTPE